MKNELLTIGPLTVYGYGAMIALGVIAAWVVTELRAKKLRLSSDHVFARALWGLLGGLLCAKLLYWITEWKSIMADPGFILDTLSDGFTQRLYALASLVMESRRIVTSCLCSTRRRARSTTISETRL